MAGEPAEDELVAYADDRLPPGRTAEVAAWLTDRPEDEKRIREWRRQTALLRAALDPVMEEPVPAHIQRVLLRQRRWISVALAACIAALAAFPLGVWAALTFWPTAGNSTLVAFAENGLATHRLYASEVRHPVEVAGDDEPHLSNWLSRRTDVKVKPPDLSTFGLKLLGGRLVQGESRPAAMLMYEGSSGDRYTLMLEKADTKRETAFRYTHEGNSGALYWLEGECAYVVSGPPDRGRLENVAKAVYESFED